MNIRGEREAHDTPCVGVCSTTNIGDNVCKGCGRTAKQVIKWNTYTKEQKIEINEGLRSENIN